MENNSVSPMPDMAPIAEFDKTPPTPPEEQTLPMDDLPPPPTAVNVTDEKQQERLMTQTGEGVNFKQKHRGP
ncbi:hypothetical protein QE152_g6098 [Popillia japonica]|uniref:Uncharacterized protein n=1 Tax=Popillia japonica TaxID=7064 RepID=A0AAW1MJX1_POPJA